MMLLKLVALSVVLVVGLVVADPIARTDSDDTQVSNYVDEDVTIETDLTRVFPEPAILLFKIIKSVIGYKFSAVGLAVGIIDWIISNKLFIIIGAIGALGFCKLTGKCSLDYEEHYIPVAQLRSFATPERLETAEKLLLTAVEKYAHKNKQKSQSKQKSQ